MPVSPRRNAGAKLTMLGFHPPVHHSTGIVLAKRGWIA
jgi:hypothetical protein